MFGFLGSIVAGQTVGSAVRGTVAAVTKKVTASSWSRILKKTLDHYCTSFEWVEDISAESCTVTNIVPRSDAINRLLAQFGFRLAADSKIDKLTIKITLKLRKDLGIFSEPWHIEFSGVSMQLELGSAEIAQGVDDWSAWSDDASFVSEASEKLSETSEKSDWLPLHKAVENMHLVIRNVSVRVNSSTPDTALNAATVARVHLMLRFGELAVATTDADWNELSGTVDLSSGGTVFKKAFVKDFEVTSHTERHAVFELTGPMDVTDSARLPIAASAIGDTPDADTPDQARVLFQGLCAEVKVTKQLKSALAGSVSKDFLGERYRIDFSLQSTGRPRLSMPSVPIVLEWDETRGTFKSIFDGQIKTSFSHVLEASELAECMWWWRQLTDAFNAAQPGPEAQLANERRWRTEEHAKACRLQSELAQSKAQCDSLTEAARLALSDKEKAKEVIRLQSTQLALGLDSLVHEMQSGGKLNPSTLVELAQQAKLLCDPDSQGSASGATPLSRVGTDAYRFGDLTVGTAQAVAQAAQSYQFGDGVRSLGLFGGKKK